MNCWYAAAIVVAILVAFIALMCVYVGAKHDRDFGGME